MDHTDNSLSAICQVVAQDDGEGVVELTATGRGAICVLAVFGKNVPQRLQPLFQAANGKPLDRQPVDTPVYGRWKEEDIIVCLSSHRYVEVHCHGGDFAKQRILADLQETGFPISELPSGNQLDTADSAATDALVQLAKAATQKTAAILTWQSEGALDVALANVDRLIEQGALGEAGSLIDQLLMFAEVGLHLVRPWLVAVAGAANAGKSSLINQMVGFDRSIVMDMPGTTRDLVKVESAIEGWPVTLVDTAGLRQSVDSIEQTGVELAKKTIETADLVIHVIDTTQPDERLRARLKGPDVIEAWNKCDLVRPPENELLEDRSVGVAALTGQGVPEFLQLVARQLVPVEPPQGQAVPFLVAHVEELIRRRST